MSLRHPWNLDHITKLEVGSDEKRRTADARDVMCMGRRIDLARIKRTFSDGDISFSDTIEVEPDKVFSCGTIVKHRGQTWRIRKDRIPEQVEPCQEKMIAKNIRRISCTGHHHQRKSQKN